MVASGPPSAGRPFLRGRDSCWRRRLATSSRYSSRGGASGRRVKIDTMTFRAAVRETSLTGPDCGERQRLATPSLPYRHRRVFRDSKGASSDPTPDDPSDPSRKGLCGSGTPFDVRAQPSSDRRSVNGSVTLAPVLVPDPPGPGLRSASVPCGTSASRAASVEPRTTTGSRPRPASGRSSLASGGRVAVEKNALRRPRSARPLSAFSVRKSRRFAAASGRHEVCFLPFSQGRLRSAVRLAAFRRLARRAVR